MAQAGLQVQLSVQEIHEILCKRCRGKLRALVKEKITDQMVDQVIGKSEGQGGAPPEG